MYFQLGLFPYFHQKGRLTSPTVIDRYLPCLVAAYDLHLLLRTGN